MYNYNDTYLQQLDSSQIDELENLLRVWGLQQEYFYQRLDKWFQNFISKADKQLAHKLLLNFDYFNAQTVEEKIKQLFKPVQDYLEANNKSDLDLLVVIPNEKGDSATRSSYDLIKQWNLAQAQIFEIKNFRQQYLADKVAIFFNDTHGSGDQFVRDIFPMLTDIHCKKFILCLTITSKAIENFQKQNMEFTITPNTTSKNAYSIFTADEISRLEELGKLVYPKHPLGYGGVALLTAYYYQCPNNTLPIVWANGTNNEIKGQSYPWNPLFEYKPKRSSQDVTKHQIQKLKKRAEENFLSENLPHSLIGSPIQTQHTVSLDLLPAKLNFALAAENKIDIAKQLETIYNAFRKEYKENGNPIVIYNKIANFLFTVESLILQKTTQIANFHWFLSYLLINSDFSAEVLEQARTHAEKAIGILENGDFYDNEIQKQLTKSHWLKALSHKMQGHFDDAHRMITDTLRELENENIGEYVDSLYLHRQKVLIEDQAKSYKELLKGMEQYKNDKVESYYTSKRIFEFAINSNNQKDFEKLFLLTKEHYQIAAPHLEQISKFSYWKYLYIYFKYTKKDELADRIFNHLLKGSIEKQLYGQQRTLKTLQEMFNN